MRRQQARYEQWVRDYSGDLYGYAVRLVRDRATAEDLVQETYFNAWKSMDQLREADHARSWLFQILRRRASRHYRAESRTRVNMTGSSDVLDGVPSPGRDPAHCAADCDAAQHAIDALSDRLKTPVLMVFLEGLTCQEAADRLDIPLGTVLSRLHRARRVMREVLAEARNNGASAEGASMVAQAKTVGHASLTAASCPSSATGAPFLRLGGSSR